VDQFPSGELDHFPSGATKRTRFQQRRPSEREGGVCCKPELACGWITADDVQGIFIVPAKVHTGDLPQEIVPWLFVPRCVGTDFKDARFGVANTDDVTDLTDAGIDPPSVNRNQWKRSAS
jgi:hypothetical protein